MSDLGTLGLIQVPRPSTFTSGFDLIIFFHEFVHEAQNSISIEMSNCPDVLICKRIFLSPPSLTQYTKNTRFSSFPINPFSSIRMTGKIKYAMKR